MKLVLLFLALGFAASCINSNNSFTGDKLLKSSLGVGAAALSQGKCITCHTEWADYTTNQQFIDALKENNELIPGNADGSGLYIRISGGNGDYSVMPQGSSGGVDPDVKDMFKTWINSMTTDSAAALSDDGDGDPQN